MKIASRLRKLKELIIVEHMLDKSFCKFLKYILDRKKLLVIM